MSTPREPSRPAQVSAVTRSPCFGNTKWPDDQATSARSDAARRKARRDAPTIEARLPQAAAVDLGYIGLLQPLGEGGLSRRNAAGITRCTRSPFETMCSIEESTFAYNPRSRLADPRSRPPCASSRPRILASSTTPSRWARPRCPTPRPCGLSVSFTKKSRRRPGGGRRRSLALDVLTPSARCLWVLSKAASSVAASAAGRRAPRPAPPDSP
jgi:hypothetical protein